MPSSQTKADTAVSRRLGVMGGTFDPIHRGHLIAAELIRSSLELETVVFVPSHCPPHKALDEITPAELRYQMVLLAISATPGFSCSRLEMVRGCPTCAGDTIEAFRKLYGAHRAYGSGGGQGLYLCQRPVPAVRVADNFKSGTQETRKIIIFKT